MRAIKFIEKLICLLNGHDYDWEEYKKRFEIEQHHAATDYVFCRRCRKYISVITNTDKNKKQ